MFDCFVFVLYAQVAVALNVGCRRWCWYRLLWLAAMIQVGMAMDVLGLWLLLKARLDLGLLRQRTPANLDRSVAGWPRHGVENSVLETPIVVFLLLEPL